MNVFPRSTLAGLYFDTVRAWLPQKDKSLFFFILSFSLCNSLICKDITGWQICLYLQYLSQIYHYLGVSRLLRRHKRLKTWKEYGFWAAKIRLLGCKNTTFSMQVIGFWFLSPWFLVSISLIFGFYLLGFWFLSPWFLISISRVCWFQLTFIILRVNRL